MAKELTEVTKKYKLRYKILSAISWLITFLPILIYVVKAFINGSPMQKVALSTTIFVAIILTFANSIFKINLRSSIWILILGIYICLDKILPLLLIIAISTILDELIITPLAKGYKNKFIINREIDKRG